MWLENRVFMPTMLHNLALQACFTLFSPLFFFVESAFSISSHFISASSIWLLTSMLLNNINIYFTAWQTAIAKAGRTLKPPRCKTTYTYSAYENYTLHAQAHFTFMHSQTYSRSLLSSIMQHFTWKWNHWGKVGRINTMYRQYWKVILNAFQANVKRMTKSLIATCTVALKILWLI